MEDIDSLIDNYKPNLADLDEFRRLRIVLLVGITGAGKDMIISELLKSDNYYDLVTTISRPPRVNNGVTETNGVDYYFVQPEEALGMVENGDYAEVSLVHGKIYGITLNELRKAAASNKIVVADVDIQGVDKLMKLSDNVTPIFIVPPSYSEWQRRVAGRYVNHEVFAEDWPRRQTSAIKEIEAALANESYRFLVNDDIHRAVSVCESYIRQDEPDGEKNRALQIAKDILMQIKSSL